MDKLTELVGGEEEEVPSRAKPTSLQAAECMSVSLIRNANDFNNNDKSFAPAFTHQIFDDEVINGYKKADIKLFFTASSLHCYLSVDAEELPDEPERDDLKGTLGELIGEDHTDMKSKFLAEVENDKVDPASLGELVETYTGKDGRTFKIYKGKLTDAPMKEYHRRMEFFALMFIENASFVQPHDDDWTVYVIFEQVKGRSPVFVGFSTVFPFACFPHTGKAKKGDSDGLVCMERRRLGQIVVLPTFQREGHGERLLKRISADAETADDCYELTVEDPADDFRRMRDRVDIERLKEAGFMAPSLSGDIAMDDSIFTQIRKKLKMPKIQARRCLEIMKMMDVTEADDSTYKPFRLWVKKRIHQREGLGMMDENKAEKKRKLDEFFKLDEDEYKGVIGSIQKRMKTQMA